MIYRKATEETNGSTFWVKKNIPWPDQARSLNTSNLIYLWVFCVVIFFQYSGKDALRRELWINISKYGRSEKDPLGKQYLSKLKKMANSMLLKK